MEVHKIRIGWRLICVARMKTQLCYDPSDSAHMRNQLSCDPYDLAHAMVQLCCDSYHLADMKPNCVVICMILDRICMMLVIIDRMFVI